MTDETYGLREAAKLISIEPSTLVYIVDVGDVKMDIKAPQKTNLDGSLTDLWTEATFTSADIERFKIEVSRRSFTDFKTQYADVYEPDTGPGARKLEFGPGWERILREFCDTLRDLQSTGHVAKLRWGKEKFGGLKLFAYYDEEIAEGVGEARGIAYGRSLGTCQECGEPARLRWGDVICLALCDQHAHLVGEPDPEKDGKILDVAAWSRSHPENED